MKGRVVVLGEISGREAAALMVDGRLEDLLIAPTGADRPLPGAIYRAVADRPMKGQGGVMVRLPDGKGFLRNAKGVAPGSTRMVQVTGVAEVGKAAPVSSWEDAVAQAREINEVAFPDFTDREWLDFTRGIYREEDGVPVLAYDPAIAQPMAEEGGDAVPPDLWPVFDTVTAIPMLVVRGAHSDILAPECVQAMQRRKPDLQVAGIPNRGHAPTLTEPASLVAIDAFLGLLDPQGTVD